MNTYYYPSNLTSNLVNNKKLTIDPVTKNAGEKSTVDNTQKIASILTVDPMFCSYANIVKSGEAFSNNSQHYQAMEIDNETPSENSAMEDDGSFEQSNFSHNSATNIPRQLAIGEIVVHLSQELLNGLNGYRGTDHMIPLPLLRACLGAKKNKLRKQMKNSQEELDFYFKEANHQPGGRILNIFIRKYRENSPPPKVVVITAYYITHTIFNLRSKQRVIEMTDI